MYYINIDCIQGFKVKSVVAMCSSFERNIIYALFLLENIIY